MIINPEYDTEKWEVCPSTIIASADHYYTKPQVDSKIAEMSGATPEQVEEIINESLEDYYTKNETDTLLADKADSSAVTQEISAAVSGKADSSAVTQEISAAVSGKADSSAVTQEISAAVSGKANADDVYTKEETDALLDEKADKNSVYNKTEVDTFVDDLENVDFQISGSVETNRLNILNIGSGLTAETQRALNAENTLADEIASKADTSSVYTKNEINTFVDDLETADSTISGAVDNVSSALTQESQRAQDAEAALANSIATKANAVDVYTKVETDNLLNEKADTDSVYTKNEINTFVSDLEAADSFISGAVDNVSSALTQESQRAISVESDLADGIDTKADRDSVYTKSEIDDYLDDKADASSVYNKTEIDTFVDDLENADFQISGSVETNRLNILDISSGLTAESHRAQDVETVLAAEIATKADSSAVTQEISAAVSGKADSDSVYTKSETDTLLAEKADSSAVTEEISASVSGKADSSAVTQEISAAVSGKQDTLISGTNIKTINNESILGSGNIDIQGGGGISSAECQTMIDNSISGKADNSAVTQEISAAVSGKADSSAVTQEISAAVSGKADSSAVTQEISAAVSGKVDTSAITSSVTSSSTNAEIPTAKAVYDAIGSGGISSAECQTMINNSISGKADSSSVYTKTEVDSALSGKASTATTQTLSNTLGTHTADTTIHVTSQEKNTWNGKQNALSAGSGITITNNTISAKIWSGTRTEWGQISGNTQADMIYFVYE